MTKRLMADLILLLVAFIWGTTFVVVQKAIDQLPPYSFLFVRFGVAFLFLLLFIFMRRLFGKPEQRNSPFIAKKSLGSGAILAIWLFAGYAFQTTGLLYTSSSKAGFITGLSVVLVPFFSFFLLKLRPKFPAVIGVILALIGLYLLAFGDKPAVNAGNIIGDAVWLNKGDLLVFFCAIGFALQIVFTGKYAGKHDAMALTLVQLGSVSLLNFIFALLFEDVRLSFSADILLSPYMIFALFITSILGTALAFLAQTYFQRYTTPTRVGLIFAMEPIFAALTGVLVAGDVLTLPIIVGCGLIFSGMLLAELPSELLFKFLRTKKNETGQ